MAKPTPLTIRPLNSKDSLEDLILLSKAFFREYESFHDYFFKIDSLNNRDISNYFSNWLDKKDKVAFVAVSGNKIVGYITVYVMTQPNFWKIKKIGHISGFMVASSMRRKGIGGKLLKAAMGFFRKKRLKYYTLFTATGNRNAIKFYQSRGLEPLYTHLMGSVETF